MDIVPSEPASRNTSLIVSTARPFTLDEKVAIWLNEKQGLSDSARTRKLYEDYMTQFRAILKTQGLDLDQIDQEDKIASLAQGWAGYSSSGKKIAPATYNLKITVISSFYQFAKKRRWLRTNPMEMLDRRKVHSKAKARPLTPEFVKERLAAISIEEVQGPRDYALLCVMFSTGRRVSELASLRCKHIDLAGDTCTLTFEHCKGGKVMRDELSPNVTKVLVQFLKSYYGNQWPDEGAVWPSYSHHHYGGAISVQAISDICKERLGTSKCHTSRHTFAKAMEALGAPISTISSRLGHENVGVTSEYLKELHGAENPYAGQLASLLGLGG